MKWIPATRLAGLAVLAGCAGAPTAVPPAPAATAPAITGLALSSPGRSDNALLERPFAGRNPANPNCVGENLSPALAWTGVPEGTRSFAIVMDDQAGRAGLGVNHWTAYGMAATLRGLPQGAAAQRPAAFVMGANTLNDRAYLGPCPRKGNAPQHYVFTLIATSLAPDALPEGLTKAQLMEALQGKALAAGSLVLRFAH